MHGSLNTYINKFLFINVLVEGMCLHHFKLVTVVTCHVFEAKLNGTHSKKMKL